MNIFGWKSAGRGLLRPAKTRVQQDRLSSVRAYTGPSLGEWPRSYEAQMREGYLGNAIAQRAVRLIAEGLASAPLTSTDAEALRLVKATSAGQALIETVAAHLLLHGNAYVEILSGMDGRPGELFALRPERVSIEADVRGWPVAYVYKVGDVASRLPAESIIHIRSMHPLDDHYGLGCLGAASGAVAIHNAATKWNKALLDNAARPSGALVYDAGEGGTLSADQYGRLKEELAASFQGAGNAGRPMLLEGGLKWQTMALTPAEMDFAGLKEAAAREIALAFGVPPVLLGLPGDATYANYREANRALWSQGILPLARKLLDALAEGLRPYFDGLELGIDLDAIPALADDRERLWAQVSAADFLTLEEKRSAVGLAPPDVASAPDVTEAAVNETFDGDSNDGK
jgi:HK97 family phage portal protein